MDRSINYVECTLVFEAIAKMMFLISCPSCNSGSELANLDSQDFHGATIGGTKIETT
jgi:hypothetical protein